MTDFNYKKVEEKLKACQTPKKGNNIITPLARISFPNLFTPRKNKKSDNPNAKAKYGISLLIPPTFDISMLEDDVNRAIEEKWGEKVPKKLKDPFLDAGEYEYEGYVKGWTLIRATCVQKPTIIDGLEGVKITEDDDPSVYPGRWGVASLRAFAFDIEGSRGVAFGLNNIKLYHHDEPLGGRMRAEDEFDIDEEYEDMKSGKKSAFGKRGRDSDDEDEEDDKPRRSGSRRSRDEEDEDESPRRRSSTKRRSRDEEDEEDLD